MKTNSKKPAKTPVTPKKFKNHFDKFPPILREMVMEAMSERAEESGMEFDDTPLKCAFIWTSNNCLDDLGFWSAVNLDAIHHKIWPECA